MNVTPFSKPLLLSLLLAAGPALAAAPDIACRSNGAWDNACLRRLYQGAPGSWPKPQVDAGVTWQEMAPVPAVAPAASPRQAARVALGRALFFDPRLSAKGQVSCASCHQPEKSFTDGKPLAVGEDQLMGRRRTPPLFAAPFAARLFWDGRVDSLEAQVLGPIANPVEMNHPIAAAVARVNGLEEHRSLIQATFATPALDEAQLAWALADFVRSLRPPATTFDRFLAGRRDALSDKELQGLHLFRTQARCMNCHNGPLLTDHGFHHIGLSYYGRRNQDLGRFEVTREKADLGAFRTPSLRGVAQAGPWMHNGVFPDLKGLLRMYGNAMGNPTAKAVAAGDPYAPPLSPLIRKLELNEADVEALAAFLQTL